MQMVFSPKCAFNSRQLCSIVGHCTHFAIVGGRRRNALVVFIINRRRPALINSDLLLLIVNDQVAGVTE
jgi:hypothetical protein